MSGLTLKNINKTFPGDQQAIRDFNLEGIFDPGGTDGMWKIDTASDDRRPGGDYLRQSDD